MKVIDRLLLWVLHYSPKPLRYAAMRVLSRRCFELAGGIERLTKESQTNFCWFYKDIMRLGDTDGEA